MDKEKKELLVYRNGTEVRTKIGDIKALTTAFLIRGTGDSAAVQYEISSFVDGEHRVVWVLEDELITQAKKDKRIGFNKE